MSAGLWLQDLESFEAISQDDDAPPLPEDGRDVEGRPHRQFLAELAHDDEVDDDTKGTLVELADDHSFLLAVEDYLLRTHRVH